MVRRPVKLGPPREDDHIWSLLRHSTITYTPPGQAPVERNVTFYRNPARNEIACVVSQYADDAGMSITNAAELVHAALREQFPHRIDVVIEYVAPYAGFGETWSVVTIQHGRAAWRHLSADELARDWPGLTTAPH